SFPSPFKSANSMSWASGSPMTCSFHCPTPLPGFSNQTILLAPNQSDTTMSWWPSPLMSPTAKPQLQPPFPVEITCLIHFGYSYHTIVQLVPAATRSGNPSPLISPMALHWMSVGPSSSTTTCLNGSSSPDAAMAGMLRKRARKQDPTENRLAATEFMDPPT